MSGLIALFFAAFLAATVIPAQSEAVFVGMAATHAAPLWLLVSVASVGNVLGAVVNWALGRYGRDHWAPKDSKTLQKAQGWYQKYGRWSLLLCWVPLIGDPITLAAGLLRERFFPFLMVVAIAKTARYTFLAQVWIVVES